MSNLTKCLKKSNLSASDKDAIKVSAKEYRLDEGMDGDDAANAAVEDAIEETLSERAVIAARIKDSGEKAPAMPADPFEEKSETIPETPVAPVVEKPASGHKKLADMVDKQLVNGTPMTWNQLFGMADQAFQGTQADGAYTVKDAYDGLEAGINLFIINEHGRFGKDAPSNRVIDAINSLYGLIPTQTKRTQEQQELQQFSTPHQHAYVMNWVADVQSGDVMMEPSAGTGNIAVHASLAGAKVHANEISHRRADILEVVIPSSTITRENAAHLNSILKNVKPTVVVMNPPFSADVNKRGKMDTSIGASHVEEMLNMLQPGGRLVALVGKGMAMDRPRFKPWWNKIGKDYDVRANIGISGKAYRKLGTSFDNQLLVIDKLPPSGREIVTGNVGTAQDAMPLLEEIRNERPRVSETEQAPDRASIESGAERPGREDDGRAPIQPATDAVTDEPGTGRDAARGEGRPQVDAGTDVIDRAEGRPGIPTDIGRWRSGAISETEQPTKGGAAAGTGAVSTFAPKSEDGGRPGQLPDDKPISDTTETGVRVKKTKKEKKTRKSLEESGSIFEKYKPVLKVKGSKPHPTPLSESVPMASVSIPDVTYEPSIDKKIIESGNLSDSQLEVIALAGQAHSQKLADGKTRRGFFVGNGTGVGKGAEIAGIFLDNINKGRKKAVWISESGKLLKDAQRDLDWVGLDHKKTIFKQSDQKGGISKEDGIAFTTYDTLRSASKEVKDASGNVTKPALKRIDQIANWLGPNFDGVIAFDEAHNMANSIDIKGKMGTKKAADKALFSIELQNRLPNARIIYASATGATEVSNMAYADRLGLWGEGTAFPDKQTFISNIEAGGVAAMEVVARDMKSMGMYESRSLSYDGVTYETLEHKLTKNQSSVYDDLAAAWQHVLTKVSEAMESSGAVDNAMARRQEKGAFWNTHQRFFNQIITGMQMPSALKDMEKQIKAGNAPVIQLVNTNEATTERRLAQAADADVALEDVDLTPRDILMQYLQSSFPTDKYEKYFDENNNERSRPAKDSKGNTVQDAEAVRIRDDLLENLATIDVPQGALDQIIDYFGPENVAEITGRKRRIVTSKDGRRTEEKLGLAKSNKDADDFMAGKKKLLVFSDAGGTGRSYHSSIKAKNQKRRVHYLVQPGWRADKVMQGFGRTHRTNQRSAPHYVLVTTDITAQKRFLSSIARRLDQLGALTKGSRDASNQGMFDASLNLENQYAEDAVQILFQDLSAGKIEGITIQEVENQMALGILDQGTGQKKMKSLGVKDLLNRLMSMKRNDMDIVFNAFFERLQSNVEYAKQQGTLDVGMETITADNIKKVDETRVYEGKGGASNSHYVKLELTDPTKITAFDLVAQGKARFGRNRRSGKLYALTPSTSVTDQKTGDIIDRVMRQSTSGHDYIKASEVREKYDEVKGTREELRAAWAEEIEKTPKTHTRTVHMITGSLLPIWDRLPGQSSRVYRTVTDEGEALLGRSIAPTMVKETLKALGIQSKVPKLTAQGFVDEVMKNGSVLLLSNGNKIKRSRVSGDDRLEITGASLAEVDLLKNMGAFTEIIAYKNRVFIPAGKAGQIVGRITASKPVVDLIEKGEGGGMPSGVGAKEGGALDITAFAPRARTPTKYQIIIGYTKTGQAIRGETVHASVQDRRALNKFWRRNFLKEGLLPDEGFKRKIEMEGAMSEVGVHEDFAGDVFKKTIKKHIGKSYSSLTIRERSAINDALTGDNDALNSFVDPIADAIRAMRGHLDELSNSVVRTLNELITSRLETIGTANPKKRDRTISAIDDIFSGKQEEEIDLTGADENIVRKAWLIMTIQGNLGKYLNRAYEAFENPKWGKKVRKNEKVMGDARDFLRDQVKNKEIARLTKEAKKRVEAENPWQEMIKGRGSLAEKSAIRDAMVAAKLDELYDQEGMSPSEIESDVDGHINHILDAAEVSQDMIGWLSNGEKLGQKDLSILKRRKEIAEPIRELLGEHKDPVYNYTRSASKMAFLVASHDFLMNIRKDGMGAFLSMGITGKFGTEILAKDPETMTPLTGLYSTKDFAQAMEDAIGHAERNRLIREWLRVNALAKYGATVLSPITTMRNFMSAAWFSSFSGHFNWVSYGGIAAKATWADLAKKGDLKKWEAYISNLIQKNVLHSGVRSEELLDAANDAINMERQYSKPIEIAKKVFVKYPTALYRAGDDFWKIIGFENEVKSLMRWRKLPRSEAEVIAADRIRNGYPTYSHVPRAIKAIRKFPVLGPFVSFPWEIMRTAGHQFRFIKEDMEAGAHAAAARRILGMSISTALPIAGVAIGMATSGVDREEDEAYRNIGPTWQRNSDLIYFRTASGQLWAYDLSHMNAYAYLKKPLVALLNGNNEGAMEKLYDSTKEVLSPYIGVEITTGAFVEWWRNKKFGTGHEVYNEEADTVSQAKSVIDHLRRRLQPGAARQLENIYLASQGYVSRGGKEYQMPSEMATFFGFRFTPVNAPISLKYRAREYSDAMRDASRLLSYPMSDPNEIKSDDIDDPIKAVIKAHKRISKDMIKALKATKAIGISPPQMMKIMKAASISERNIAYLRVGKVPPWTPTDQFLRKTLDMALATAKPQQRGEILRTFNKRRMDVMRAANRIRRETKQNAN